MILYATDSLFAWDRLDDSPQLRTIQEFFERLADGPLIEALVQYRAKGRNDCPVRVLWFCVKQQLDLRRFPPIPRATKTFERLYKGRTAVERVNARLKVFWGVDDGNVARSRQPIGPHPSDARVLYP